MTEQHNISIELRGELLVFVESLVASKRYPSVSAAVREGLELLQIKENRMQRGPFYFKGTWLEPESRAGTRGACLRRGYALLPDGTLRSVRAGIPDTAMSIPAYYVEKGKRVKGYLTHESGVYYFHKETA